MKIGLSRRTAIGLDVGARWVCAVQLASGGGAWRVEAAVKVARSGAGGGESGSTLAGVPAEPEMARVWEILGRQGFTGRRVVLVAPESAVFSSTLELPPRSSGAPVDELARAEIARSVKKEVSEIEVASWDVPRPPRSGEGTHLLAVGMSHADSERILDVVEGEGRCVVEALDCRCCAMARACEGLVASAGGSSGVTAIVDVGDSAVSIAVMHSGVVVYDRVVRDAGLDRLREMVGHGLGVGGGVKSEAEAGGVELVMESLAGSAEVPEHTAAMAKGVVDEYVAEVVQELRSVLAYSIHRYPGSIGPVLMVGPGAGLLELGIRIRRDLDLEARVATLGDVAERGGGGERVMGDAAMTVAAGLAMRLGAVMRRAA